MTEIDLLAGDADAMRALGARVIAPVLRAGDVVIIIGDMGAGKTTLAQGIGAGLGVRGPVASPTFIIARTHPSLVEGPPLVHVDAYRLRTLRELDDLDLDTALADAVTIVEWGEEFAQALSHQRVTVTVERPRGSTEDAGDGSAGARSVRIETTGHRWADVTWPNLTDAGTEA